MRRTAKWKEGNKKKKLRNYCEALQFLTRRPESEIAFGAAERRLRFRKKVSPCKKPLFQ